MGWGWIEKEPATQEHTEDMRGQAGGLPGPPDETEINPSAGSRG